MKAFKIILIILLAFIAINIIRDGSNYPLPQILPFCAGKEVSGLFDLGAILLIVMALMGISNLNRKDEDD